MSHKLNNQWTKQSLYLTLFETGSHFVFLHLLVGEQYLAFHLRASQSACAKSTIHLCGLYQIWVIDQALGQEDWTLGKFIFSVLSTKTELIYYLEKNTIFFQATVGNPKGARCPHFAHSGKQSQHWICYILSLIFLAI